MSLFKRLSTTVVARIDQVADRLENHDAAVQAALADMQRRAAEANVRFGRVRRELENVEAGIDGNRAKAAQWRRRAVDCGREDETRALECLARAGELDRDTERLEVRRREYTEAAAKMEQAIAALESRVAEIRQKQVLMRARQSTGRALSATAAVETCGTMAVDEVLERWEVSVLETEMMAGTGSSVDSFEKNFDQQENQQALKAELNELLGREKNNDH